MRPHTAIPEVQRLVRDGQIREGGVTDDVRRVVAWWTRKRERGEAVGPGLLVSALREPGRITDSENEPAADAAADTLAVPEAGARAQELWSRVLERLEADVGDAAARDWLRPLVPVALVARAGGAKQSAELTLWVPNATFATFLSGKARIAQALRTEANRCGVASVVFATDGG